jgi:hypothetical protein
MFSSIEKLNTMKFVSLVKPVALLAVLACFFAVGCGGEAPAPVAPEAPAVVEEPAMEAAPAEATPAEAAPAEAAPAVAP